MKTPQFKNAVLIRTYLFDTELQGGFRVSAELLVSFYFNSETGRVQHDPIDVADFTVTHYSNGEEFDGVQRDFFRNYNELFPTNAAAQIFNTACDSDLLDRLQTECTRLMSLGVLNK